jgi:hypothetical protein
VRTRAFKRLSEHLISVPAVTLSARKGGEDEREFVGPLLSADGCARRHTHTLRTPSQITIAAAVATMHKDTGHCSASHTDSQTSLSRCLR